jgi:hypothetical protein
MIVRGAAILSALTLLLAVLYFPSEYSASAYLDQLRAEHDLSAEFWGTAPAWRALARTLDLEQRAAQQGLAYSAYPKTPSPHVDQVVARQMSDVTDRLLGNQYFQSIEALFVLAAYRLSMCLELLPALAAFLFPALVDGLVRRAVKAKQFQHHNPEVFASSIAAAILVCGATAIAVVGPWTLHPAIPVLAVCVAVPLLHAAIANFHLRG